MGQPAAIMATTAPGCKVMADGTLRITVEIPPTHVNDAFALFGQPGVSVALAKIVPEVALRQAQNETIVKSEPDAGSGYYYAMLYKSGWFHNPQVAPRFGTDEQFQDWVRRQPSAVSGEFSEYVNGDGRCEFAHVRRAGDSGTGYKPKFRGIPLTHAEHALQHQKGESALMPPEKWDQLAAKYRTDWIKTRLYDLLNVRSLTECDPADFVALCCDLGLENTLPK